MNIRTALHGRPLGAFGQEWQGVARLDGTLDSTQTEFDASSCRVSSGFLDAQNPRIPEIDATCRFQATARADGRGCTYGQ
jgi:hypothetical protein